MENVIAAVVYESFLSAAEKIPSIVKCVYIY